MPTWKDIAPRFGVVYDLFGNAKTALKFGLNRYNESRTTQFANRYNPLALDSASMSWTDMNSDDIAQGELGCTYLTSGVRSTSRRCRPTSAALSSTRVDPDFKRVYNVETTAGVQHELFPRVSLSANWYRRTFHRLRLTDNLLRTMSRLHPSPIFNPIDRPGVHHLRRHAGGRQPRSTTSTPTPATAASTSTTRFDINMNARLPDGGTVFGGFVTERNCAQHLRRAGRPEHAALLRRLARTTSRIGRTLKLSGTYPLRWGDHGQRVVAEPRRPSARVSRPRRATRSAGLATATPAARLAPTVLITRATRYPANCPRRARPVRARWRRTLTSAQ